MRINKTKGSDHYHHGDLRRALIGKAINILESEGEAALTMRRIARDAGVSQAAPYSHFKSKKDLLTAVCVEGTVWFGDSMKARAAGKQGLEYLAGLAVGHVQFALEHPALFRLMSTRPVEIHAHASQRSARRWVRLPSGSASAAAAAASVVAS